MTSKRFSRRAVLRGLLQGSAISVGLPVLDVFLNGNGTALAAGGPLPLRFGTWFWGCGMTPEEIEEARKRVQQFYAGTR